MGALVEIRELTEDDVAEFWALRLRALREDPEAFGSSYEESKERPLAETEARLRNARQVGDFTLGAFVDGRLVGIVALVRATGMKNRHIADVYSMYVAPEARGQGVGRALMQALIDRARAMEGLERLLLAVVTGQGAARGLYRSLGFEAYGLQLRALKLPDGRYLDEELMALEV